ncbi:unnamed protein product [Trifolium pratense]|uniref:Uncharacterized protein n=1 Tax=Trifolium pratense TaxID=57577 RepID=A0ACB0JLH9_TRIPR|nr:unnamed protein product [Trifolium pratense]
MIRAFAKTRRFRDAIYMFRTMFHFQADIRPDNYTYACVIRACSNNFDFRMLRLVHGSSLSAGLGLNPICCSALVGAYSKLGFVHEVCRVFNGIAEPDLVLWNSLILAYVCSMWDIRIQMFSSMRHYGRSLMGSLLVSLYLRCMCMDSAYRVFCCIFNPDLVTWSALIAGYSQCGEYQKVLLYFRKLNMDSKRRDSVLIATVLASIAQTAIVVPGCEVHGYVLRHGLESHVKVSSALIDMYSKCGFLHLGTCVFKIMPERNIISYNSVILAKACMDVLPRLSRCLMRYWREDWYLMKQHYLLSPEHYVYMVKLLGSAGGLEEAYNLTQSLPEPVDKAILGALLSCCDSYGNSELAETVAPQIFKSNPSDNVYKVMFSNIYAGDGRWDDAKKLRDKMIRGQKKIPGISWIEGSYYYYYY